MTVRPPTVLALTVMWRLAMAVVFLMQFDTAKGGGHTDRSLLVDGVMSVDFASIFQSNMANYNAAGSGTGSGTGTIRFAGGSNFGTALSTTGVTFYQPGISSGASGFNNTGTALNPVYVGRVSYVVNGISQNISCIITRDQKNSTTIRSFYCYDNIDTVGYLLVLKSPPAAQDYTSFYNSTAGSFSLTNLTNTSLDNYRIAYINTLPTAVPSRSPTQTPTTGAPTTASLC